MSDAINPTQAFGQWYGVGQALGNAAQVPGQMQAYQAQQAQQAEQQKMMEELRAKALAPTATAKDRQQWVMFHAPEQAEKLTQAFSAIDKTAADEMNLGAGKVVAYLRAGNKDAAKALLEERALMGENSGNAEGAKFSRSLAQTIDVDPRVAENYFIDMMAFSPGGDKVIENLNKVGEERREVELQPGVLAKQAADLGYTKAQTAKMLNEIRLAEEGKLAPEKVFEQEEKLRKELNGRTAIYQELGSTYEKLSQSANAKTPAGDIALITAFMKMLDPGSVVRETEFAKAQDTAGIFDKLVALAGKAASGNIFPNTEAGNRQRKEYVDLAKKYFDSAEKKKQQDVAFYRGIATGYGLDFGKIDPNYKSDTGETPKPSVAPGSIPPKKVVEGEF